MPRDSFLLKIAGDDTAVDEHRDARACDVTDGNFVSAKIYADTARDAKTAG